MNVNYCLIFIAIIVEQQTVSIVDAQSIYSNYRVYEESGDYIIGGLFPVHYENCLSLREMETLHRLEAMAFAIRQINERKDILPNIKLGFRIYDTCSYEPVALSRATLFIPAMQFVGNTTGCEDAPDNTKPIIGEGTTCTFCLLNGEKLITV